MNLGAVEKWAGLGDGLEGAGLEGFDGVGLEVLKVVLEGFEGWIARALRVGFVVFEERVLWVLRGGIWGLWSHDSRQHFNGCDQYWQPVLRSHDARASAALLRMHYNTAGSRSAH